MRRFFAKLFSAVPVGVLTFAAVLLALWQWLPPTPRGKLQTEEQVVPVDVTNDGLLVTGPNWTWQSQPGKGLRFWDFATGLEVNLHDELGQQIDAIGQVTAQGELIAVDSGWVFRRTAFSEYVRIFLPPNMRHPRIENPAGIDTYLVREADNAVLRWKDEHAPDRTFSAHPAPDLLSPDGKLLAGWRVAAESGEMVEAVLWDVDTGREVAQLRTQDVGYVSVLRFSRDTSHLACTVEQSPPLMGTIGLRPTTYIWNAGTGQLLGRHEQRAFAGFVGDDRLLLVQPAATQVLTASSGVLNADGVTDVYLLDANAGAEVFHLAFENENQQVSWGGPQREWFFVHHHAIRPGNDWLAWLDKYFKRGLGAAWQETWHDTYESTTGKFVGSCPGAPMLSADGRILASYVDDGKNHAVLLYDFPTRRSPWRVLATALIGGLAMAWGRMSLGRFMDRVRRK